MAPLIEFPTKPPFQTPRKRGARAHVEIATPITSNHVDLIEDVRLDIAAAWRRGVQLAWLAKIHQLTVGQTEYIIWCEQQAQRRAA